MDKSAHRDHLERLVIPASHLKGKLRSSLEELDPFFDPADRPISKHFLAARALRAATNRSLRRCNSAIWSAASQTKGTRTRVTINRISQTAQQNLLREVDDLFASGTEIRFTGEVTFNASDLSAATRLASVLRVGLQWLATVGSEKGVGFGRLKSAQVVPPLESTVAADPRLPEHLTRCTCGSLRRNHLLAGGLRADAPIMLFHAKN